MKTKAEIRKHFLTLRRPISPADAARWNAAIQARVLALPEMQGPEDVYIYVAADNEVETRGIIEELLRRGRRVLIPAARGAGVLEWGEIESLDELQPGTFGMLEPPATSDVGPEPKGVAIAPCVAFTAKGDRLGRGGGYYDRFLATFIGPTVALAYELQRAEALPAEAHDVRTKRVVTEKDAYTGVIQPQ